MFGFDPYIDTSKPQYGTIDLGLESDTSYKSQTDYEKSPFYLKQIYCLAITIYGEARGESDEGRRAVAHVVMNRQASRHYPYTACDVVAERWQFESIYRTKLGSLIDEQDYTVFPSKHERNRKIFNELLVLSEKIYWGEDPDITNGATHFWSPSVQAKLKRSTPTWATARNKVASIDKHWFHRPY